MKKNFLFVFILPVAVGGCQTAGRDTNFNRIAVAGKPLQVAKYISLETDCTSTGAATVRILQAPAHGTVSVRSGTNFPGFPTTNVRSSCNAKQVPSQQLWYVGRTPGVADRMTVEIIYASGTARTDTYTVSVR